MAAGSGTTAGRPSGSEPAVTRNNSLFAARSRHPMHVRTGPLGTVQAGETVVRTTVLNPTAPHGYSPNRLLAASLVPTWGDP
jgi:hypothetical protein